MMSRPDPQPATEQSAEREELWQPGASLLAALDATNGQPAAQEHHSRATITRLGRADLHLHSRYSDGLGSIQDILAFVGQRTELEVIALTDHDTIEGALRARDLAQHQG